MPRTCLLAFATLALLLGPAFSQDGTYTFRTGRELLRTPQKYVGQTVSVTDGYCVFDDPSIVCFGNETPFEVKAITVLDAPILAHLKDKCGGDLPGREHDPSPFCHYAFSFVPTKAAFGIGDYVLHDVPQSSKRLVLFEADIIELRR